MNSCCADFRNFPLSRRKLLQVGGLGAFGLTLPRLLAAGERRPARPSRIRTVVLLFQFGGPSHIDTFDMKPDAPDQIRGPQNPASSSVPGLPISEHLPNVATIMHKVTLIRSMHHEMKNHNTGSYYALTGHNPPRDDIALRDSPELYPAYGSMVDRLAPLDNGLPTFVAFPHVIYDGVTTPGQNASFLGKRHDPLLITEKPNASDFRLPELTLPANLSLARLQDRRAMQTMIDRHARLMDRSAEASGIDAYYERSLAMLNSPVLRNAFDLSQESQAVRDGYGPTIYGQSCLLARRLVEAGVKFINVYYSSSIGSSDDPDDGWDTHGEENLTQFPLTAKYHYPITDRTLPRFLGELEDRGLLDETLVIWMGEFGRTPKINKKASRDHWPACYSVLLAGGGVKQGFVYGASDKTASFPTEKPVRPEDLAATMYYLLGIDPQTEVHDLFNRPRPIAAGQVINEILA